MGQLETELIRCCTAHLVRHLGYQRSAVRTMSAIALFRLVYPDIRERLEQGTANMYGNGSMAFVIAQKLQWVDEDGRLTI